MLLQLLPISREHPLEQKSPCRILQLYCFIKLLLLFFKSKVSVSMSGPEFAINLGFMTEVQMIMGLKGSWVLTNFLAIRLTEFTGPHCAIN